MTQSNLPKLAEPAERALAVVGIKSLEDMTKKTEQEIRQLHGMGPNAMKKLKEAMSEMGLSFNKSNG